LKNGAVFSILKIW